MIEISLRLDQSYIIVSNHLYLLLFYSRILHITDPEISLYIHTCRMYVS